MTAGTPLIRPSTLADLPAITAIYGWNVLHGTGTFELEAPDEADMTRRRDDVLSKGLPWLVVEVGGRVLGYAYANHFRPRRDQGFARDHFSGDIGRAKPDGRPSKRQVRNPCHRRQPDPPRDGDWADNNFTAHFVPR